jgi:hypothetical protein
MIPSESLKVRQPTEFSFEAAEKIMTVVSASLKLQREKFELRDMLVMMSSDSIPSARYVALSTVVMETID